MNDDNTKNVANAAAKLADANLLVDSNFMGFLLFLMLLFDRDIFRSAGCCLQYNYGFLLYSYVLLGTC